MNMTNDLAGQPNAYILGYVGAIWAMLLIPFWVALLRKHPHKWWVLAANFFAACMAIDQVGLGWFGMLVLLVWACWSYKKSQPVQPQVVYVQAPPPMYQHYQSYPAQYQPEKTSGEGI